MNNKYFRNHILTGAIIFMIALAFALTGCGSEDKSGASLSDGTYIVDVDTGSSMFHINEANEGKGLLTVEDGEMTLHISLASKKIVNLYQGPKADAKAEGAKLIEPTKDKVKYDDGIVEEVYGYDIPVPVLDEPFLVSIIGTHDNWYEHEMTVSNPVEGNQLPGAVSDDAESGDESKSDDSQKLKVDEKATLESLDDGEYKVELTMEGGTGRAEVESPADIKVEDGKATLTVVWSSSNYDYMLVDGEKYEPVNTEGNSTFEIPMPKLNEAFPVVADTTAMSKPHEIDYSFICKLLSER